MNIQISTIKTLYDTKIKKIDKEISGISHVVSQFIVSNLEKFAISLGQERVKCQM